MEHSRETPPTRWVFIGILALAWGAVLLLDRWLPQLSMAAIAAGIMIAYAVLLGYGELRNNSKNASSAPAQPQLPSHPQTDSTPQAPTLQGGAPEATTATPEKELTALAQLYPEALTRPSRQGQYSPQQSSVVPHEHIPTPRAKKPILVTVMVPAHNEEAVIETVIRLILAQTYEPLELIVIDDRSNDDTPIILRRLLAANRLTKAPAPFQVLFRGPDAVPGKAAVLNDAMALANGQFIAVFDADAVMPTDFVARLMPYFDESRVAAVQARKVIANETQDLLTRCQAYEYTMDAQLQCGRDALKSAVEIRGNGFLVRREALESVGGFTESSITDDLDLSTKLHIVGWDIRFVPTVTVLEEGVSQWWPLVKQRVRWAEGSLMRYLMYGGKIFKGFRRSPRAVLDMLAYFVQFLFPLWVISDYILLAWDVFTGQALKGKILSSAVIMPLLFVFFAGSTAVGLRRFYKLDWVKSLLGGAMVGLYMPVVWLPVMFWVMGRLALMPRRVFHWEKTSHRGVASLPKATDNS
ncbi:MAG: glycosyltransferase family 2 protein [Vampirovibrionales bacterium]|nr:glycosyltransferase family 2 protein [Vampirovibrionales bacterium]